MVLITMQVNSQQKAVTEKVTGSEDGQALPGVTVKVKGTNRSSLTDSRGTFSIRADRGQVLVFSFVGNTSVERTVSDDAGINVALEKDVRSLSEVVVTAFGVEQQKRALGYSVQEVKAREIADSHQPNIVNALQGKVAGVQITNSGGAPGASAIMVIRGGTSLSGNNQPLYVVDGIPVDNSTAVGQGGQGGTGMFKNEADYGKFSNSGFYTKQTSPFPFITYSEVKLIEAEARLRSNDITGALSAYEQGVKANMRKLGVTAAEINAYWAAQLADGINAHFTSLTNGLSYIMQKKYILLCFNPEIWVDMRRMDYSQQIYGPSLQRPANPNTVVFSATDPNDWIRAMVYETNEQNRNPAAVGDNSEQTRLRTRLWWDQP